MTPEVQAAAKRYAMGDYSYWCDDGLGRLIFDSGLRDADLCTLADAYLSLGERQPDKFRLSQFPQCEYDTAEEACGEGSWRQPGKPIVRVVTFISPIDTKGSQ